MLLPEGFHTTKTHSRSSQSLLSARNRTFALVTVPTSSVGGAIQARCRHNEAKRGNLVRVIWNLKTSIESAAEHAHPRIGIDNAGHIGKAVDLLCRVVNCIVGRSRVLDAAFVA